MIRTLMALVLVVSLSACGGDGGDFEASDSPRVDLLQTGDSVEVFEGDELEKVTDAARISVRHEEATNRKFVTVLSGTAELVRGDFYETR